MANLAPLEAALAIVIDTFRKHAAGGKDARSLSQTELTELLNDELPNLMKVNYRTAAYLTSLYVIAMIYKCTPVRIFFILSVMER